MTREDLSDPSHWEKVIGMIPVALYKGHFTEGCTWHTIVLISKRDEDFRCIGLIEVLWKTVIGILNLRLTAAIHFHITLHGFRTVRGMETPSLKYNLLQQLMDMKEEVLYEIFLDIHKS